MEQHVLDVKNEIVIKVPPYTLNPAEIQLIHYPHDYAYDKYNVGMINGMQIKMMYIDLGPNILVIVCFGTVMLPRYSRILGDLCSVQNKPATRRPPIRARDGRWVALGAMVETSCGLRLLVYG